MLIPKNHREFFILLLFTIFFASGCIKVGPDFTPPAVQISKKWLDSDDRRVKAESEQNRYWWRVFKDPLLDKLIEKAYQENLPLRVAGLRVLEARAQLGIAIGDWYPQTQQMFGSLEKIRTSAHVPAAAGASQLNFSQSEIGLQASWELDFWGKFRRAIEASDASLLAAMTDYDSILVSLTADVANSYILIRTVEKRLGIARQNVAAQQESLEIADVRFKGGTTSQRDVEQAKTQLSNTKAAIPSLEIQLRQAKNALSVLLGMPPSTLTGLLQSASEIPVPPPYVAAGIPADLLRRRPDIKSVELEAAAQCAQIGVAKADLLPALSLNGTFGLMSSDVGKFKLEDMFQWRSREGSGGIGFQWNVLNYGRLTNQVRVQDARFQEVLITYQNAVLRAQQEVEDSLVAFLQTQERASVLTESTEAAKRSLEIAVLQYRQGITDFTTVLIAQLALLNAQDSLANTLGDISHNLVGVYRALGGGWQIREGNDFVPESIKREMAKRTDWGNLLKPTADISAVKEKHDTLVRPPVW